MNISIINVVIAAICICSGFIGELIKIFVKNEKALKVISLVSFFCTISSSVFVLGSIAAQTFPL